MSSKKSKANTLPVSPSAPTPPTEGTPLVPKSSNTAAQKAPASSVKNYQQDEEAPASSDEIQPIDHPEPPKHWFKPLFAGVVIAAVLIFALLYRHYNGQSDSDVASLSNPASTSSHRHHAFDSVSDASAADEGSSETDGAFPDSLNDMLLAAKGGKTSRRDEKDDRDRRDRKEQKEKQHKQEKDKEREREKEKESEKEKQKEKRQAREEEEEEKERQKEQERAKEKRKEKREHEEETKEDKETRFQRKEQAWFDSDKTSTKEIEKELKDEIRQGTKDHTILTDPVRIEPLPVRIDDFEPWISRQTLFLHYGRHYVGYVNKTNAIIAAMPSKERKEWAQKALSKIVLDSFHEQNNELFDNAAQVFNHEFFFDSLRGGMGGEPTDYLQKGKAKKEKGRNGDKEGDSTESWDYEMDPMTENEMLKQLQDQISKDFGSFKAFHQYFVGNATALRGSGWIWLTTEDGQRLQILTTRNAENTLIMDRYPLFTIDLWEHAYYLDHKNHRGPFVDACLKHLLNWDFVAFNYAQSKAWKNGTDRREQQQKHQRQQKQQPEQQGQGQGRNWAEWGEHVGKSWYSNAGAGGGGGAGFGFEAEGKKFAAQAGGGGDSSMMAGNADNTDSASADTSRHHRSHGSHGHPQPLDTFY